MPIGGGVLTIDIVKAKTSSPQAQRSACKIRIGGSKAKSMKITEIKPNENNPRFIADAKFEKLKKSIESFPQMMALRPIVVDADNVILGGNMRFRALQDLGYKEIPDEWVKKADELTEEQKREFIIKDNSGFGSWDWDALANEWDTEQLSEWGLDMPDDWAGENEQHLEAEEDDYQEPDNMQVDVVLGDFIEIGEHRLLCGDSTDSDQVEKLMDGEKADMVFTDPPYDFTDYSWTDLMFMYSHGHQFVLNSEQRNVDISAKHRDLMSRWYAVDFRLAHMIASNRAMNRVDFVAEFRNSENVRFVNRKKGFTTLIESLKRSSNKEDHKQAKNPELPSVFIEHHTVESELVLDLFAGSGSTMVAAHQLNRKCYGMELDPKYCQVIIDRMHKLDPSLPIKINGKDYTPPKQDD